MAGDGEGERGGEMADGAMVGVVLVVVLIIVVRGRKLGGHLLVVVVFTSDCFKSERVCYIIIIIT